MNKHFAIGDIHGHFKEMMLLYNKLIKEALLDPVKDTVVFLGDMVDGGPDTNSVIAQMISWQKQYPHWQFLYGSHEDLMLDALGDKKIYGDYYIWYNLGGKATLRSYLPENATGYEKAIMQPLEFILLEHIKWLKERPLYYETDNYFFVHAGIKPDMSIEDQVKPISHPQDKMRYDLMRETMLWTRYEFINSLYDWGKKIIFGHTPTLLPIVMANKIGIDTMPRENGKLCAVELPAEKFYFQDSLNKFAW